MLRLPGRLRPYRHVPGAFLLLGLAVLVAALPFVSTVLGIDGPIHPVYAHRLTKEIDGIYVTTKQGYLELFAWSNPLDSFPSDGLRVHQGALRYILVNRDGLDPAYDFALSNLRTNKVIPMHAVKLRNLYQMKLIPSHALAPGRYLLLAPATGMEDGNMWYYFAVVRHGGRT